jgi:hypothetical protein
MTPNGNSTVTQRQLSRNPTASQPSPNGKSTVAMPQLNREPRLSCRCTPILTSTYQSDFAVRFSRSTSTRSVAAATRREFAVARVLQNKNKTYRVQPC